MINSQSKTIQFWLIAAIPAIGLIFARNLTFLFQGLFNYSMRLPLPFALKLELPDIIIEIFIPIVTAFVATLVFPVATSRFMAILFAIPVFIVHLYSYAISDWVLPGIYFIVYPGDTPGAGYQMIMNGAISVLVSLLLLTIVAVVGWLATKISKKA